MGYILKKQKYSISLCIIIYEFSGINAYDSRILLHSA
jgi:hypothetical protein